MYAHIRPTHVRTHHQTSQDPKAAMDDAAFQELEAEFSTTLATLSADPALATFKREYEKLHEALVRVTDNSLCSALRRDSI